MARVFISYRRIKPDQDVARAIRDRLIDLEHQVFFDTSDLHAGDHWKDRLGDELAEAEYFIPLVSSSYLESDAILEYELSPAVRRVSDETLNVLPVNVAYDGTPREDVRDALGDLQHTKWKQHSDTPAIVAEIERQIPDSLSLVRGARAFDELDVDAFAALGRQAILDDLVGRIRNAERPHVLLHGPSGAGKTSFLKAGLHAALGGMPVVELIDGTAEELRRATTTGALVALDQFEQVLIVLAGNAERAEAFDAEVEALTSGGARFLFCIREEYRTAFETLLPRAATESMPFALLPFSPDEAVDVLTKLLENGRVEYDRDALPGLCETMAEGVPRTVLPAILQIVVQHCRETGTRLSAATREELLQKDRLFTDHIRDSVLARVPRSVPELDAAATLLALTDGEVKSRWKTSNEIAEEERVAATRVERALRVASGRARVVTMDFPEPGAPPRYRLAHDLFVAPVQRLHGVAKRRRIRRNRILGAFAVCVLIAAMALVFRAMSSTGASRSARSAFEEATRNLELGHRDATALYAARAFALSNGSDPLRPTYALTSLHASLALAPPIVQPIENYDEPRIVGAEHVVIAGPGAFETYIYPAAGAPLRIPPLSSPEHVGVSRDGQWVAANITGDDEGAEAWIFDRGRPHAPWRDEPDDDADIAFNSDAALIIGTSPEVRVWDRASGGLLLSFPGDWSADFCLRAGMERMLTITQAGTLITNLRNGGRVVLPGKTFSAKLSRDGGRVVTAGPNAAGQIDLRLWDATSGQPIHSAEIPAEGFRIDDVSVDGTKVLGIGDNEQVYLWRTAADRLHSTHISGLDFHLMDGLGSSEKRLRFIASDHAFVSIAGGSSFSMATPMVPPHPSSLLGAHVVTSWTADGTFRQWGPVLRLPADVRSLDISPDDVSLRAVLSDRRVVRYDLRSRLPILGGLPDTHDSFVNSAQLSRDLRHAVAGTFGQGQSQRVVDLRRRKYVHEGGPQWSDRRLTLLQDRYVIYDWLVPEEIPTGKPARVQILDLRNGTWTPRHPMSVRLSISDVAISPEGDELRLLGSGFDRDVRMRVLAVNLAAGNESEPQYLPRHMNKFTDENGEIVVGVVPGNGQIRFELRNVRSGLTTLPFIVNETALETDVVRALLRGARVQLVSPHEVSVTARSGARFRIVRRDNGIVITNPESGTPLVFPRPGRQLFQDAIFSYDGKRVALIEQEGVQLWDLTTGRPIMERIESPAGVAGATFIESDTALAVMSSDGLVRRIFVGAVMPYARRWTFQDPGDWLSDLAAYTTGLRLDAGGTVALPQAEHDAVRVRLLKRLREAARTDPNAQYALEQLGWK